MATRFDSILSFLRFAMLTLFARIMAAYFKVGQDPATHPVTNFNTWDVNTFGFAHFYAKSGWGTINEHVDVQEDHKKIIRDVAAKGTVLLKNKGGVLPLGKVKQIGIFGSDAGDALYGPNGCSDRGCDNGMEPRGIVLVLLETHITRHTRDGLGIWNFQFREEPAKKNCFRIC